MCRPAPLLALVLAVACALTLAVPVTPACVVVIDLKEEVERLGREILDLEDELAAHPRSAAHLQRMVTAQAQLARYEIMMEVERLQAEWFPHDHLDPEARAREASAGWIARWMEAAPEDPLPWSTWVRQQPPESRVDAWQLVRERFPDDAQVQLQAAFALAETQGDTGFIEVLGGWWQRSDNPSPGEAKAVLQTLLPALWRADRGHLADRITDEAILEGLWSLGESFETRIWQHPPDGRLRWAREWVAREPNSASARSRLIEALDDTGREHEAATQRALWLEQLEAEQLEWDALTRYPVSYQDDDSPSSFRRRLGAALSSLDGPRLDEACANGAFDLPKLADACLQAALRSGDRSQALSYAAYAPIDLSTLDHLPRTLRGDALVLRARGSTCSPRIVAALQAGEFETGDATDAASAAIAVAACAGRIQPQQLVQWVEPLFADCQRLATIDADLRGKLVRALPRVHHEAVSTCLEGTSYETHLGDLARNALDDAARAETLIRWYELGTLPPRQLGELLMLLDQLRHPRLQDITESATQSLDADVLLHAIESLRNSHPLHALNALRALESSADSPRKEAWARRWRAWFDAQDGKTGPALDGYLAFIEAHIHQFGYSPHDVRMELRPLVEDDTSRLLARLPALEEARLAFVRQQVRVATPTEQKEHLELTGQQMALDQPLEERARRWLLGSLGY